MKEKEIFDEWPEKYESWFLTPTGSQVLHYEQDLVMKMINPGRDDLLLDAGCGTGIFTRLFDEAGASVTGVDISLPMLRFAADKLPRVSFLQGDMLRLPFRDNLFDFTVSITALEFIEDAACAINELFRVTRPGGKVLVATLNSLSSWAAERAREAAHKGGIFKEVYFRSPVDLAAAGGEPYSMKSVVHFGKNENLSDIRGIESAGNAEGSMEGAFLAALWVM